MARTDRQCRAARRGNGIADTMGKTLLLAWSGASFMLSALPIWVRPIGVAMSFDQP